MYFSSETKCTPKKVRYESLNFNEILNIHILSVTEEASLTIMRDMHVYHSLIQNGLERPNIWLWLDNLYIALLKL